MCEEVGIRPLDETETDGVIWKPHAWWIVQIDAINSCIGLIISINWPIYGDILDVLVTDTSVPLAIMTQVA